MKSNLRTWGLLCGAAVVTVLAGGWFVGVQPTLANAASMNAYAEQIDTQNQQAQARIAALAKVAAKQQALETENSVLLKSVPTILKPNTFIRRVDEVAALDGVTVLAITPGTAEAYIAPIPAAGGNPAPKLAQTDVSISAANFTAVPVSIALSGSADAMIQFVHDIQADERTFAINSLQYAKTDAGDSTGTASGYIYTLKR